MERIMELALILAALPVQNKRPPCKIRAFRGSASASLLHSVPQAAYRLPPPIPAGGNLD